MHACMNSVYATMIISEWPVCEPAPVGGARLLSWPLVACRGGPRRGAGALEKHPRAARHTPASSSAGSAGCQPLPLYPGFCCAGQGARHRRPCRGASKKTAQQKRRGLAPKKRAPPLLSCFWSPCHTEKQFSAQWLRPQHFMPGPRFDPGSAHNFSKK